MEFTRSYTMPKYPAQIDTTLSLPTAVDNLTPVQGKIFNKLRDAVLAIESELGVKPSASYSTVKARIDALEGIVGNLQIIELDGDLGGTLESPLVIGFQGRPVSTVPPQQGEVYVWDGLAWTPLPQSGGGGGGGITPGGDLSGGPFLQTVIGLQNRPIDTTAPTPFQSLIWNGVVWKPGNVPTDLLTPPVELTITPTVQFAEVNENVTAPAFTATYTATPTSALLEDSENLTPQNVTSTPLSFSSIYNFTETSFGDSVDFTLTAVQGFITKSETTSIIWGQKTYWGVDVAGQTGAPFITSLAGQEITVTKQIAFAVNASSTQKVYFACRNGYGDIVFTVHDVEGGFTKTQTIPVTNDFGFIENYDLYESDYAGLGAIVVLAGEGDDEIVSGGGPVGPQGPTGPAGPGGGWTVDNETITNDIDVGSNILVACRPTASMDLTLVGTPTAGDMMIFKDSAGVASTFLITIFPAPYAIDGSASISLSSDYESVTILFDGTDWSIV